MAQKNLTNKDRLLQGAKVLGVMIWGLSVAMTFSFVMNGDGSTFHKVVAGVMLASNAVALAIQIKKIWDNE